jgi:hypothetical protein
LFSCILYTENRGEIAVRTKSRKRNELRHLLEKDENDVLNDSEKLKQVLCKLRFEGRQHFKKNLSKANSILVILRERLFNHIQDEERYLFPFLITRLPKLESAKHLFLAEHREFKDKIKDLTALLKRLKPDDNIHEAYSEGMYLVCLILSHVKVEGKQLYKAIENELTDDEKGKLKNLLILNS